MFVIDRKRLAPDGMPGPELLGTLLRQHAQARVRLDEIGDMPMEMQTRLLRVLSDGCFYRVGGCQLIRSDVPVIAATNQNQEARLREGHFREDLFHR